MGCSGDGMMLVRADLCERLEALQAMARRGSERELAEAAGAIRLVAAAYGLTPVARLAEALERAITLRELGCPPALYLDRLHDAIGCTRLDEQASQAMLASVSVRLGA